MIILAKNIISSRFAAGSDNTEYTAPLLTTTIIDKFVACNTDGSSQTISINIVPFGGSVGASNLIIDALSITSKATKDFTELQNFILNPGDFISVAGSISSTIAINASGREIT